MKNLWSTTKVPVSVLKDAETIKAHEQTIKDHERTIKILKEENSYLKSSFEEDKDGLFPPAEKQRTIAEENRDKDLGAVRVILARRIREELIQKALEGGKSMRVYVNELVRIDGELLKQYNYDDIMEPIVKSLREEGYWVESVTSSIGGCFRYGYLVSWG